MHTRGHGVLRSISARAFLYFPCALYVYACTCLFTRVRVSPSMPPLSCNYDTTTTTIRLPLALEIRPRSFAFLSAQWPSWLRFAAVRFRDFSVLSKTSLQFSARTKRKKNLILPRVMRFFNRKFHTSNRETKRVSFEMYFRGTCEHASRSEKKDGNRYHEQFFFLFLFFLSFSRFKIYR